MKKLFWLTFVFVLFAAVGIAYAQDSGSIRGAVAVDVNGDGKCVGTGVTGEVGIANVPLQFVNSDGGIVMNHTTGSDGTFGLVSVGDSYWGVTVQPGDGWKITSAATLYALIDENNRLAENINFCLQSTTAPTTSSGLLPQAGGAVSAGLTAVVALVALSLIALGLLLQARRRA
ncbi:MAG: hypothetical protein R3C62_18000 [Chloroflexota bacterium]